METNSLGMMTDDIHEKWVKFSKHSEEEVGWWISSRDLPYRLFPMSDVNSFYVDVIDFAKNNCQTIKEGLLRISDKYVYYDNTGRAYSIANKPMAFYFNKLIALGVLDDFLNTIDDFLKTVRF